MTNNDKKLDKLRILMNAIDSTEDEEDDDSDFMADLKD